MRDSKGFASVTNQNTAVSQASKLKSNNTFKNLNKS